MGDQITRVRFGLGDATTFVAATGLGFAGLRRQYLGDLVTRFPVWSWRLYFSARRIFPERTTNLAIWVTLSLSFVAAWSTAGWIAAWRHRARSGDRANAGILAMASASAGFVATFAAFMADPHWRDRFFPAENRRLVPATYTSLMTIACGLAVAIAWGALILTRRWRASSSWPDRLGRAIGAWCVAAAVLSLCSTKHRAILLLVLSRTI